MATAEDFRMERLLCPAGMGEGDTCRYVIALGARPEAPERWAGVVFHCVTHDDDYYAEAEGGTLTITHIATNVEAQKVN